MKKRKFVKCTFLGYEYKSTSVNGNPSFWIFLLIDDSYKVAYTASDASCGYSVRNNRDGDTIYIKYRATKKGRMIVDYLLTENEYQRFIEEA